jgi:hypothetical protein
MSPEQPNGGALAYRLKSVEDATEKQGGRLGGVEDLAAKHEVELHGERGVYDALRELTTQLKWTQRALWGLAASVLVAALTLALTSGGT